MRRLIILLTLLAACSSGGIGASVNDEAPRFALLVVKNEWQETITIYTAHYNEHVRRVGQVDMKSSKTFLLMRSDLPGEMLQICVLDRLSGVHACSDVVQGPRVTNWELDFGPLPAQAFLFPKR